MEALGYPISPPEIASAKEPIANTPSRPDLIQAVKALLRFEPWRRLVPKESSLTP